MSVLNRPLPSPSKHQSKPLSVAEPTEEDEKNNEVLMDALQALDLYESPGQARQREEALLALDGIVQDWVYQESKMQGWTDVMARECRAYLYAFGSYRLAVHTPKSDIDTLCVAPKHIERGMFFTGLYNMLKGDPRISQLMSIPEAFVPVITFRLKEIDMDLVFATLPISILPTDLNLHDDAILEDVDNQSILSLNGLRVTDMIYSLVPNVDIFRASLRCIKAWGKRRGIYSNVFGYLGGVSWAILVARICQLYPNALPATVVNRFFQFYHMWKWPTPISLVPNQFTQENIGRKLPEWNPNDARDRSDLVPIITPAYPAINSTHNVSTLTLGVLQREFKRGLDLTVKIAMKPKEARSLWLKLLEETDFFFLYPHYLAVEVLAGSKEELRKWLAWVESKMRVLIMKLGSSDLVIQAHPLPSALDSSSPEQPFSSSFFIGVQFRINKTVEGTRAVDISQIVHDFKFLVYTKYKAYNDTMHVEIKHYSAKKLPERVFKDERRPTGKKKDKKRKPKDGSFSSAASKRTSKPANLPMSASASNISQKHGSGDLSEGANILKRSKSMDSDATGK